MRKRKGCQKWRKGGNDAGRREADEGREGMKGDTEKERKKGRNKGRGKNVRCGGREEKKLLKGEERRERWKEGY